MLRPRQSLRTGVQLWLRLAAIVLILSLVPATLAHAAGPDRALPRTDQATGSASSLAGVWLVNPFPDNPSAQEVVVLTTDGFMFASSSPSMPAMPGEAPPGVTQLTSSQGFGIWQAQPTGSATFNFIQISYDQDGNYQGRTSIHGTLSLGPSGNSITGSYVVTLTFPDGTSMDVQSATPVTGTRVGLS
jgi:hypothetical protein